MCQNLSLVNSTQNDEKQPSGGDGNTENDEKQPSGRQVDIAYEAVSDVVSGGLWRSYFQIGSRVLKGVL